MAGETEDMNEGEQGGSLSDLYNPKINIGTSTSGLDGQEFLNASSASIRYSLRSVLKINKHLGELDQKIESLTSTWKSEMQNSMQAKIETASRKALLTTLQMLGLFIAFFSFISIEFQMFKGATLNTFQVLGLTAIMLGSLLSFVAAMDYFVVRSQDISQNMRYRIFGTLLILIIIGSILYYFGSSDSMRLLNTVFIIKSVALFL